MTDKQETKEVERIAGKLFVMAEPSEAEQVRAAMNKLPKDDPMKRGILTTEMPLARLVDGDALCCMIRRTPDFVEDPKMGQRPIPGRLEFTEIHHVADHWDARKSTGSGHVQVAGFLDALGQTIIPATIKRQDPKHDQDSFRIGYA